MNLRLCAALAAIVMASMAAAEDCSKIADREARLACFDKSQSSSPATGGEKTAEPKKDCCVVCKKGIPCGNSCISAKKTCRQPAGCACGG